ncbi:hypothetical protein LTR84_007611 [Exophiala bonariae]|uniref:Clr5 domain-containing protein n=1 Tax=Exophiala bonariae TaxID=1690606 RepID=A0AAV9NPD4_9EURO|nr:hypothetical protein LTR84_007611 [Exophiala bonariae]
MLRGKIQEWGLGKKNTHPEMITAVKIVADAGLLHSFSTDPQLRIRGRLVPFSEVRRYFHRKHIHDLGEMIKGPTFENYQPSPNVMLVHQNNVVDLNDEFPGSTATKLPDKIEGDKRSPGLEIISRPLPDFKIAQVMNKLPRSPSPPTQFARLEDMLRHIDSYCLNYLEATQEPVNDEPQVHMLTTHGRFASKIQDTIFHIQYGDTRSGFTSFDTALSLLSGFLEEVSPPAIAQGFAVICELEVAAQASASRHPSQEIAPLRDLHRILLRHLSQLSMVKLGHIHPLTMILRELRSADSCTDDLVRIMHKMIGCFTQAYVEPSWKQLYLRERYCDCLFYANITGERQSIRQDLLVDQEALYGKNKSNVVWTLTNVADDFLESHQVQRAEAYFMEAISRADRLGGFAKAKNRFAALEGLAKVALVRLHLEEATQTWARSRTGMLLGHSLGPMAKRQRLNEAVAFLEQAATEAELFFEPSGRRLARVRRLRQDILSQISQIDEAFPPEAA